MASDETSSVAGLLSRFLLDRSGLRGVHVRLDAAWRSILSRGEYPMALAQLLGETAAAAALFTGHVKVEGRLSIQLRGSGALRTVFAECTAGGTLRGLARHEGELPPSLAPPDFGADAMLAITIESALRANAEPQRYQGLVALDADSLAQAFEGYFSQSEQLPTRILLAADGEQACGLILQQLPGATDEPDAWPRAQALFDTLTRAELLQLPAEDVLYRLFHEEGVRLLQQSPLRFGCPCSRPRVGTMLLSLGRREAFEALQDDGRVEVICEFCGQHYHFDTLDLEQLFAGGGSEPAPGTLQ
ncbi:Hsp33 family molecular chaperone HslO [Aquimonas sp.]|jgi:molecular chaperone Hsp33|uniref:Hsp33 family molecular chaperone HslO n=1 Tax=Aquimonas sp. TaxID=1872588 RepID=UPI0037BFDDCE